ncbi:MAG: DUF503 domain-containing protein [Synergistaceae bacterium]|jgi:uncharacterized protein YlxP (DUF503 family)|nr:DUF503 domain-containing protein [Synergistaceae bacterium]
MRPWVGVVLLSARISAASSLKDRRQVVRSLLDRIKKRFNASLADLGPEGSWDRADIAAACVGSDGSEMERRVERMCSFMEKGEEDGEFEILDLRREVFPYGDF